MKKQDEWDALSSLLGDEPLDEASKQALMAKMENNPQLKAEYETLKATKKCVERRRSALRSAVPSTARQNIMQAIAQEAERTNPAPVSSGFENFLERLQHFILGHRFQVGIASACVFVLASLLMFQDPSTPPKPGMDLIKASKMNYSKVVQGEMVAEFKTASFNEWEDFARSKGVDYDLFAPEMPVQIYGGLITEVDGHKIAHLIMKTEENMTYMCQIPKELLAEGKMVVCPDAMKQVNNGVWYWDHKKANEQVNLGLYDLDETLCSLVSGLELTSLKNVLGIDQKVEI